MEDKTLKGQGRNSFLLTPARKVRTVVHMDGRTLTSNHAAGILVGNTRASRATRL